MRVNYIYKKESDGGSFSSTSSTIELKEYQNDLVFYSPMNDSFRAEYAHYDKIAQYEVKPEIFDGGPFGSFLKLRRPYSFDIGNFSSFQNPAENVNLNARISFYLGSNKLIESTKIALKANDKMPASGLPKGSYSFTVTVDGKPTSTMILNCTNENGTSVKQLKNKILFKLDPMVYPFEINIANNEENTIILQSNFEGKTMKITDGQDGINLLDYFDVSSVEYGSAPHLFEEDIFKLFNLRIGHYRSISTGDDKSVLNFYLTDEDKEEKYTVLWNSDSIYLDNIEVDFDDHLMYIFINGELKLVQQTEIKFKKTEQTLILCDKETNSQYSFDEIIINKSCIHTKDFDVDNKQLTKYSVKKPFIDFYFSGKDVKKGMALSSVSQSGIRCVLCDNGNYYYYSTGAWRRARGSFEDTNDWATFTDKIKDYDYTGHDFFIRMFFFSDGVTPAYIDNPYFEMEDSLYEDKNGNIAAILVGDKEWSKDGQPVIEDLMGKKLVIITDLGTSEIEFTYDDDELKELQEKDELILTNDSFENDGSYESSDGSNEGDQDRYLKYLFDINQVVDKINNYYPEGILKCYKDSKDRVILISETKGSDAYIMVKGDAAPLIFGYTHYAKGQDQDAGTIDYTKFYDAVRTYTGAPLISMEITDDQMKLFLKEALAYYKKWRATEANQYTCQLKGDWTNGWEIPTVVESQKDIIDIIFKPIFPITFYGAGMIGNGTENIFTLTLAQSLFGGRGGWKQGHGITQDYYISLMGMQDFKQVLGLNPSWEIMNNRIYIFPSQVARFTNVAIKYKAPLSEEECLKDPDMIKYVHGKCLMTMGNIRGQYGSNLTSGETSLTFNADALYERGKTLVDEVLNLWMKQQPPGGFFLA